MTYYETYRCNKCFAVWEHEWNTEDYSNDYTLCPTCNSTDFEEVEPCSDLSKENCHE